MNKDIEVSKHSTDFQLCFQASLFGLQLSLGGCQLLIDPLLLGSDSLEL